MTARVVVDIGLGRELFDEALERPNSEAVAQAGGKQGVGEAYVPHLVDLFRFQPGTGAAVAIGVLNVGIRSSVCVVDMIVKRWLVVRVRTSGFVVNYDVRQMAYCPTRSSAKKPRQTPDRRIS